MGALCLAAIGGLLLQVWATSRDENRFPPPGQLVDIGGYRLHIHCLGEGNPTVILDPGVAAWSINWWRVHPEIAKFRRACVFDRAGLGWSESGRMPRTSRQIAEELHLLLRKAGIDPPYVLVGHSFGGYNVRLFADAYRNEVAGVVLVDSAHPDQWERLPEQARRLLERGQKATGVAVWLARFGLLRLGEGRSRDDLPPNLQEAYRVAMLRTRTYGASLAELSSVYESARQVLATKGLADLPLAVVSARNSFDAFRSPAVTFPPSADETWMEMQRELTALSTNTKHLISEKGTHRLYETEPGLIVDAVRDVLARIQETNKRGGLK